MIIAETERLRLRHFRKSDAEFIYQLYNQPSFIKYIGDRGIHSVQDAEAFISKVEDNYQQFGFWLYLVEDKETRQPLGVNGLIQRDYLDAPDIGFALIPEYCGKGFAKESSLAVIDFAMTLGIPHIYAITIHDNIASQKLLLSLNFTFNREEFLDDSTEPTLVYLLTFS
ncbi:GNAT family N-acetyltransferase [Kangiella aquimarina]|uniref:GNAT family N-acetyltransferase n=1 Tax=Kangiella aquimarina TaxID=261965 RepID=A0ABZ0X5E4_9GAMM|nr:GNAT family N-acetyltransferase [Kangiella aquimarina]WQG85817.1 GNAT family N-acetyltransferase [Kangiella aquimarina]